MDEHSNEISEIATLHFDEFFELLKLKLYKLQKSGHLKFNFNFEKSEIVIMKPSQELDEVLLSFAFILRALEALSTKGMGYYADMKLQCFDEAIADYLYSIRTKNDAPNAVKSTKKRTKNRVEFTFPDGVILHSAFDKKFPGLFRALEDFFALEFSTSAVSLVKQCIKFANSNSPELTNHMAFVGPPGVGKSKIAETILPIFCALGLTKGEGYELFCPSSEIQTFIGHTERDLLEKVSNLKTSGGILFVDEAYQANQNSRGNRSQDFMQNAMNALMNLMLDLRTYGVVVIFAGYSQEIADLLSSNSGWNSRIRTVEIPEPSIEQLADYICSRVKENDTFTYSMLREDIAGALTHYKADNPNSFANYRTANEFYELLFIESKGDILTNGPDYNQNSLSGVSVANACRQLGVTNNIFLCNVQNHVDAVLNDEDMKRLLGDSSDGFAI